MTTIGHLGEFGLIDKVKAFCPTFDGVVHSIGDDTAVLSFDRSYYQLLTTDMMVEDVHFTKAMDPALVGHKALACNISDIAAMGGLPTVAVISIGLPKHLHVTWIEKFYQGLGRLAKQFKVSVVGGDTVRSKAIVINIALLGLVEKKNLVTRSGAKSSDVIFVSGALGGSFKSGRHLNFIPCVNQARFLVNFAKPSAMMDISDGLAGDLNHLLRASKVGCKLDEALIPKHQGVSLAEAMTDGEDYQLLFTMSGSKARKLESWQMKNRKWFFYRIGQCVADKRQLIKLKGFTHF